MKKLGLVLVMLLLSVVSIAGTFSHSIPKSEKANLRTCGVSITDGDLLNELNEKFILTKFRSLGTWLQEVTSKDSWVGNNAIKIPKRKGDSAPVVLINNTVYPMLSSGRDDEKVIVALNKYDTENREVTQDELYAIAYDKEGDINMELKDELEIKVTEHALYSISPVQNSASTPVLETTGPLDGTRRRLVKADVIRLKAGLDKISVPKTGRIWVMSSTHANDLLLEDAAFEKGYQNRVDGAIAINYYGFKIYEEVYTPSYHATTKVKLAFDAVTAGRTSSIIFHKSSCVKAKGTVDRFARDRKADPEYRKSVVGYQLYFGCFAIQDQGLAAIIDGVD
ncbi:hypothetical protein [Flavobacterium laiguense]|uniref:Uncharacterized protein n=1 Tax=Flavobacterium laiguense TaxID=2169409 RepID=A0A2U1K0E7_9FLAO|nr:hypothetical protein [Flavobacterium laiguense]PWA10967.1 hypothetical protein DB891_03810 [Flavobacterium laiguense]